MAATSARRTRMTINRLFAAIGLVLLLAGVVVVVTTAGGGDRASPAGADVAPARPAPAARAKPKPRPKARPLRAVALRAVGAFDPEGDGSENDELAAAAADGNLATSWRTERYRTFFKQGVGLVLTLRRAAAVERVVVTTDTPGFTAEIRVGARPEGPFRRASAARTMAGRTAFRLRRVRARYLVVWITALPDGGAAHVTEVRALGRG